MSDETVVVQDKTELDEEDINEIMNIIYEDGIDVTTVSGTKHFDVGDVDPVDIFCNTRGRHLISSVEMEVPVDE